MSATKILLILFFNVLVIGGGYYFEWYNFPGLIGVIAGAILGGILGEPAYRLLFKSKEAS